MTDTGNWAAQIRGGDVRAISRALTAIEDREPEAEILLRELFPHTGRAYRVGVTGAPGTGKSTLVDRLVEYYRGAKRKVGVLAVDPSSPFTGGAILGDRVRMQRHASDTGVFIRSMATRGYLGGLSQAASDATLLLDAAGREMVLIETVGVGQGEVDIVRLADCTLVVLIPGMGDDVQSLKAGVMEIGDIFVVNKADREGAGRFEEQLRGILSLVPEREGWKPPVVRTVATENRGIGDLAAAIEQFRQHNAARTGHSVREERLWKERLLQLLQQRLLETVMSRPDAESKLEEFAKQVTRRECDPYTAVETMLAEAGVGEKPVGAVRYR
jgi:LAO/AO transport system kinase